MKGVSGMEKDTRAGREKEGDSARTSVRQGRETGKRGGGKTARRGAVKAGHERRRWGREERTPQDGQRGGGEQDIR